MTVKVENDMLVLDSTFTKEDVMAINEFVRISVRKERENILRLLENYGQSNYISMQTYLKIAEALSD